MLPDADGLEICRYLKRTSKFSSIPLIMLTAKSEELDKVLGLELGADDYMTKPFSSRELTARVKAVLRRRKPEDIVERVTIGGILQIDSQKYDVTVQGKIVTLTTTEFKILKLLSSQVGRVFTRNYILDHLWGEEKFVLDRTIDVHIKNLKDKLGPAAQFIENVRGVGCRLEA